MKAERKRGAVQAVRTATPKNTLQKQFYQAPVLLSNKIDQLLAGLLFGLQSPRPQLTASERTIVLNSIDGLIRLKINLGLVKGLRHAC